jgi:hypothetical protein
MSDEKAKKAVVVEKDYPLSHVPKEARTGLLQ